MLEVSELSGSTEITDSALGHFFSLEISHLAVVKGNSLQFYENTDVDQIPLIKSFNTIREVDSILALPTRMFEFSF